MVWTVLYLNLHGNLSSILQHPMMHLSDRSCSKRFILKRWELLPPSWPELLLQDFLLRQKHTLFCVSFDSVSHFASVTGRSCLRSSAMWAWSLRSVGLSQRSSATEGWWRSCLRKGKTCQGWKTTLTVSRFSHEAVIVSTLYAEHLAYFQSCSSNLTQRVDNSFSVGLRQEGRVHKGIHLWKHHIKTDKHVRKCILRTCDTQYLQIISKKKFEQAAIPTELNS